MFNCINRRVTAGVMVIAFVASQVILPTTQVFALEASQDQLQTADPISTEPKTEGTTKPTVPVVPSLPNKGDDIGHEIDGGSAVPQQPTTPEAPSASTNPTPAPNPGVDDTLRGVRFQNVNDREANEPWEGVMGGSTFEAFFCTSGEADLRFRCGRIQDENPGEDWFDGGLMYDGDTYDGFYHNVPVAGGWGNPVNYCIVIREKSHPFWLEGDNTPLTVCAGENGWTKENVPTDFAETAQGINFSDNIKVTKENLAPTWTVVNDPGTRTTRIINHHYYDAREYRDVFQKVNEKGELVKGAKFKSASCRRPEQGGQWLCESQTDLNWTKNITEQGWSDSYDTDFEQTGGYPGSRPVVLCLMIQEVEAPVGYLKDDGLMFACRGQNGWSTELGAQIIAEERAYHDEYGADEPSPFFNDEAGITYTPSMGNWSIHYEKDTKHLVFQLVNKQPGKGGVEPTDPTDPTTPTTPVSPIVTTSVLTTPSALPHTGSRTDFSGLLTALMAAIATYGAVYFAYNRKR